MFVTIVTDCVDENARGRQLSRAGAYFSCPATLVGIHNDLEAAGNLIDVLDAGEGGEGIVLVNVAPRNGDGKKWPNGTPFGFFYYKRTLVLASVDGLTLSLAKKLGIVSALQLFDITTVTAHWKQRGRVSDEIKNRIDSTQFRSFEFLPRAALAIYEGGSLPATEFLINAIPDAPKALWWVDNFGNCKTTLLKEEINTASPVETSFGNFAFSPYLKDVPERQYGIVVGSSGIGERRFLEIVVQGGNAAQKFNLASGSVIM